MIICLNDYAQKMGAETVKSEIKSEHVAGYMYQVFGKDKDGNDLIPRLHRVVIFINAGTIPIDCKGEESAMALIKALKGIK